MNQPPPISGSAPKTSALAITSLVLGIIGVLFCFFGPIFFGVPAIVLGHMAAGRINRSGGALTGKPLAIAGFICGYVSLAMIVLLLPIAIPNFIRARQTAQVNGCINNLRLIDAAKEQWAVEQNKDGSALPTADDLQQYIERGTSTPWPTCPAGGHYTINTVGESPTCDIPEHVLP